MSEIKSKIRLSEPYQVQRFLCRLANEVYFGKAGLDKARCLTYICKTILEAMSVLDIEKRIEKIEEAMNEESA